MLLDYMGRYYFYKVKPTIDSLAKAKYLEIEDSKKPEKPVAVEAYGKAAYSLSCLDFYMSNKLDSIAEKLDSGFKGPRAW